MGSITVQDRNKSIYCELSNLVKKHDKAKKVLINCVNRSKLHYMQKYHLQFEEQDRIKLMNCLLVGESGTGKTYLVESLAKIMNFPLLKIDATSLNPTGASGGIKQEKFLSMIKQKAEYYCKIQPEKYFCIESALDQMIVFVDEVDKISSKFSDNWNQHVQSNFLTLFENKSNYSSITYIFAGSFASADIYNKTTKNLGFTNNNNNKPLDFGYENVVEYGMLPEFVGRLGQIVLLDKLMFEDYLIILDDVVLPVVLRDMPRKAVFYFDENIKNEIITKAQKSGLGIRSLYSQVNEHLIDLEFECCLSR